MLYLTTSLSSQKNGRAGLMKKAASVLAAASLLCGLTACNSTNSSQETTQYNKSDSEKFSSAPQASQWPRTVDTDDGTLELTSQPHRIVSTSVNLTGSLLALDAPVVASGATVPNQPGLSDKDGFLVQWSKQAKEAGVEKLWENSSPDIERVPEYNPDLIIVSKSRGDSVFDQVDKLRQIAPVMVVEYSDKSWQDVTTMLAKATGFEEKAKDVIASYEEHVKKAKEKITLPEGKTSPFIAFADGSGAAALTKEAPQSQILTELGFDLTDIPEDVKGDTSMGKDRGDIVKVSLENVQKALPGDNWIAIATDEKLQKVLKKEPAFNTAPAAKEGRLYTTPAETFLMDYYTATILVDSIVDQFKK